MRHERYGSTKEMQAEGGMRVAPREGMKQMVDNYSIFHIFDTVEGSIVVIPWDNKNNNITE